jgi:peptidoglycan-associated lipoprotein
VQLRDGSLESDGPRFARWAVMAPNVGTLTTSMGLATLALFAIACGASKAPVAAALQNSTTSANTAPAATPPSSQSPTASNVSISDEIRGKCGISDADAYFPFDSANVTSNDRSPLDQVVKCFTHGPLAGRSVKLVGRADPRGPSDYNLTLGQSRADAVSSYLSARGMAKDKAQPTSRGAMDAAGTDESGWQRDRRVDVLLGN